MSAAAAQHWYERFSTGVTVFFMALMVVAAVVVAVRAIRGKRPTKEIWDALLGGGALVLLYVPELVPHSKVPATVGMVCLLVVWFWRVVRSSRRRRAGSIDRSW